MVTQYKFLLFIGCLIFMALKSFGQSTELRRIEYLTPDTVKDKILEVLKEDKTGEPFYVIWNTKNDTTSIMVSRSYSRDLKVVDLIKNSNRYINLTEKQNIPVILTSDILFSTFFHSVKNKGKENEIISETILGASGYIIEFTGTYGKSKLIKFEYFTY